MNVSSDSDDPGLIAFYYPQFHQSVLNDRLYGPGFTEWTNVERGEPLFPGHHQPREPHSTIGRYSLDNPDTYSSQVQMAREAGISGFCFYHYWMTGGRRILERPFQEMLESDVDFPFCLMWTNHDWTMAWRGEPHITTLEMTYAVQDPEDFIADIAEALIDPRYIRIDEKPLLTIYDVDGPDDLTSLVEGLRDAALRMSIGELFIAGVQYRIDSPNRLNPSLDAICEFVPHGYREGYQIEAPPNTRPDATAGFFDYRRMAAASLLGVNLAPGAKYFRCLSPEWDNTSRRMENLDATVYVGSTPTEYERWASGLMRQASEDDMTMPLVFVNAWNEWGEAAYLEPDSEQGSAYLDATRRAVSDWRASARPLALAQQHLEHDPDEFWRLLPRRTVRTTRCPAGDPAMLWLDNLQFQKGPLGDHTVVFRGVAEIQGFVVHPDVHQPGDTTREHLLCFCSEGGDTYEVKLPAVARRDLLLNSDELTESNVDGAGFQGRVDFRTMPVGEYTLRIALGTDLVGVLPTTIAVVAGMPTDTVPRTSSAIVPAGQSMFEPTASYTATFSPGSAHQLIASIVQLQGAGRVLDCGCADGSFGAHLVEHLALEVHGLEYDEDALAVAQTRLARAAAVDFELDDWAQQAVGPFDALLFIDVLEHVRRPDRVLGQARSLIGPGGILVASIPNVAHISQRVALVRGSWDYQDWGLLDRTHLRFFTRTSIEQLFEDAGYAVREIQHTVAPPNVDASIPAELRTMIDAHDETALAYQYIVVAEPR